jgi:ABC-type glycerol-3-phosphate transport system substrate-binding protein
MKKIVALTLAAGMTLMCTTACGGNESSSQSGNGVQNVYNVPGENKTELKMVNFNGGIGSIWIEEAAERFAEIKQNESYATDKKGIYISIDKTMSVGTATMQGSTYNIYIDERMTDVNQLAQAGMLLPITDIVKDTTRVGGTIESKLFPSVVDSLKGNDGEYYALPHYEFYGGFSYNRQTFDDNLAYFASSDTTEKWTYQSTKYGSAEFVNSVTAKKSKGPDGEFNTEDDGLPCSLEEFIILMDYFKNETSYAPMIVSGMYQDHINYAICGLWAALAGSEQMKNYYNCTGEVEVVDYSHPDGAFYDEPLFTGIDYIKKPRTKKITLTEATGYLGNDMVAKYYAYALMEIIEKEGFYSSDSYIGTRNQYDAQLNLYMNGTGVYGKTAMLIEGSYWHNESKKGGAFATYERMSGKNASDLDLRFMGLPTSALTADNKGGKACMLDIGQTFIMINGNIKGNTELTRASKEFLCFLYSEQELKNFTICTGQSRPLNYNLSSEEKEMMGSYYTHLWDLRDHESGSNIVFLSGSTTAFKQAKHTIKLEVSSLMLRPDNKITAFDHFRAQDKNTDGTYKTGARAVFEKTRLSATQWASVYTGN